MKIYAEERDFLRRKKPYENIERFDIFLDYQAQEVYQYEPLKEILKNNLQNLFFQEIYSSNETRTSYNGVLAYGEVQSGKTSNMLASTLFAYDQGFKYVFIFTGNIKPLHQQTIERFSQEVKDFETFFQKAPLNENSNPDLIYARKHKLNPRLAMEMYDLQGKNVDVNYCEELKKSNNMQIFFVLKNPVNYQRMFEIIQHSGYLEERNAILLLDDESDWGFKNSSASQDEEETKIFQKLEEIKNLAFQHQDYLKYIGFTATPYKIIESNQDIVNDFDNIVLLKAKKYQDWMSQEEILENDPFYCGIDIFHPQLKKSYNFENQNLREILNKEFVTVLYHHEIDGNSLLYASLLLFLINSYLFKVDSNEFQSKKNIYGLFFPAINTDIHREVYQTLIEMLPKIRTAIIFVLEQMKLIDKKEILFNLEVQESFYHLIFIHLIDVMDNSVLEIKKIIMDKLKSLSFPRMEELLKYLLKWINLSIEEPTRFIVKMSGKEENNDFSQKKPIGEINSVFIIGGYKISRGVTFNNLVFECLVKKSEKYDSTLQRARWFGYRKLKLLKNTDIILSADVNQTFELAAANDFAWREHIINQKNKSKTLNYQENYDEIIVE